jgi:hypothetical protein
MGDVPVATRGIMFLLTDVLLIPEATENLISVRHATKRGLDFKFSSDRSEIFRKGLKVATARCTDDAIYYLTGQSLIVSPGQGTAMVYVPRLPRLVATAPGCFLLHLCCSPCALVLLSPAALPLPRVIASTCDSVTSTVHWSLPDQCKGHNQKKGNTWGVAGGGGWPLTAANTSQSHAAAAATAGQETKACESVSSCCGQAGCMQHAAAGGSTLMWHRKAPTYC